MISILVNLLFGIVFSGAGWSAGFSWTGFFLFCVGAIMLCNAAIKVLGLVGSKKASG